MTVTDVTIKRIILDWDCRQVRALQAIASRARLRDREVILAYNRALTMVRLVDRNGSCLTCYAEVQYEVDTLLEAQEESFGIRLRLPRSAKVLPFRKRKAA